MNTTKSESPITTEALVARIKHRAATAGQHRGHARRLAVSLLSEDIGELLRRSVQEPTS